MIAASTPGGGHVYGRGVLLVADRGDRMRAAGRPRKSSEWRLGSGGGSVPKGASWLNALWCAAGYFLL